MAQARKKARLVEGDEASEPLRRRQQQQQKIIPVSTGKPSLRLRLEAYYSLVAPEQIASEAEWRSRFDQIWSKFGGTTEGERKLAARLAKKYGNTVRLLLAESSEKRSDKPNSTVPPKSQDATIVRSEDWFQLTDKEKGSRCIDFTSNTFDPVAALQLHDEVQRENPWVAECPILDRVDRFAAHLPITDPLYRPARKRNRPVPSFSTTAATTTTKTQQEPKSSSSCKVPLCFASLAEAHETGPYRTLYEALHSRTQRVRVLIRNGRTIRGTLTGYLLAFDKHMNMILRDCEETYTVRGGRPVTSTTANNNNGDAYAPHVEEEEEEEEEEEVDRRFRALVAGGIRQRHMKQLMVRGDSVVLVYKAEQERSAWPVTAKAPVTSLWGRRAEQQVPEAVGKRVGTPASLIYAAQQRQRRQHAVGKSRGRRKGDYVS
jgi:small nuclear ribonucleoprotein (snRNP)-like protein